jgi:negative regulator of replication initiation
MRKVKLYLIGQKYEVEMEDEFYEYIKSDITKLMNSNSEVKDMLNILLKFSYKSYKSERQLNELLNKLEL